MPYVPEQKQILLLTVKDSNFDDPDVIAEDYHLDPVEAAAVHNFLGAEYINIALDRSTGVATVRPRMDWQSALKLAQQQQQQEVAELTPQAQQYYQQPYQLQQIMTGQQRGQGQQNVAGINGSYYQQPAPAYTSRREAQYFNNPTRYAQLYGTQAPPPPQQQPATLHDTYRDYLFNQGVTPQQYQTLVTRAQQLYL